MSLLRYPRYKDSGVQWLGEVPEHWGAERLDRLYKERREEPDETAELISAFINGQVTLRSNRPDQIIKNSGKELGYKKIYQGDLVISGMNAHLGGLGISDSDGKASPVYIVLTPLKPISEAYISYLLRHYAVSGYIGSLVNTIRYNSADMKYGDIRNLIMIYPPLPEQAEIATYLGRETAKIDTLVEEQEKLVALLEEKRQAVISHAVTKGVNPNVPMKNSGVEWIGETPTHWSILPIKYLVTVGNGSTPKKDDRRYWENGTFPWLTSGCVNQDEVESAEQYVTEAALRDCHLPIITPPAVLVGITGQGKTRGMAATLKIKATINQHIAFLKPTSESVHGEFLRRFLEASYEWLRFNSEGVGSTKGAITCEQLANTKITLPPLAEQKSILHFIRLHTERIDHLRSESQRNINLLKERRSALISAAVTGKIDVRGLVAEEVSV